MVKNRGLRIFMPKNTKKATIRSNFAEFSRTRLWSKSHDYGFKMFLEVLEFFLRIGIFQKRILKKVIADQKKSGQNLPPLG